MDQLILLSNPLGVGANGAVRAAIVQTADEILVRVVLARTMANAAKSYL
jgi:hypothetical protein